MELWVDFGTLLLHKSVGLRCTDKLHNVRVPTIWYLKDKVHFLKKIKCLSSEKISTNEILRLLLLYKALIICIPTVMSL